MSSSKGSLASWCTKSSSVPMVFVADNTAVIFHAAEICTLKMCTFYGSYNLHLLKGMIFILNSNPTNLIFLNSC